MDIKSAFYKNNVKRKDAIAKIAKKLGIDEETVKKKIASIRATYLLEKKKINDSQRTGMSTDDIYCPTVPWIEHKQFLNDVIIARKTISNLESKLTQVCSFNLVLYFQ